MLNKSTFALSSKSNLVLVKEVVRNTANDRYVIDKVVKELVTADEKVMTIYYRLNKEVKKMDKLTAEQESLIGDDAYHERRLREEEGKEEKRIPIDRDKFNRILQKIGRKKL